MDAPPTEDLQGLVDVCASRRASAPSTTEYECVKSRLVFSVRYTLTVLGIIPRPWKSAKTLLANAQSLRGRA
jgi:hypothetical protein